MSLSEPLTPYRIRRFREAVLTFYRCGGRGLSWRSHRSPYRILVSEIMLQQTQVERVKEKFEQFMRVFPGLQELAGAPLSEVLKVWQGLGYNRRARYLHQAAAAIIKDHAGRVPRDLSSLRALPGIGDATAASIRAFAFDLPCVFIETNIRTVFIHHFFAPGRPVRDAEILPLVEQTLDRRHPRQWYYALMDYGVWLKKEHANPSRRSAHHTRQSRFEGSLRQLRGRILREVLQAGGASEQTLRQKLKETPARFKQALDSLTQDGLVKRQRGRICA